MDVGLLILRVVVGGLFAVHGAQKLFGWFGGYGIEGTTGFMGSLRFRHPRLAAIGAGTTEVVAGLLLVSGLFTPLAAAMVVGVMINAIVTVNLKNGLIGGYELELLYAIVASALAFTGAGAYAADAVIGWDLSGPAWGSAAIALGVLAAALALASRTPAPRAVADATDGSLAA